MGGVAEMNQSMLRQSGFARMILAAISVVISLIVFAFLIYAPFRTATDSIVPQSPSDEESAAVVTMAVYTRIEKGMTYEQVRDIIGAAGEETNSSAVPGIRTVGYAWTNSDGSNMSAIFQNGSMTMKSQFGLP